MNTKHTPGPWVATIGPPEHLRHGRVDTRIIPDPATGRDFIIATCEYGVYGPSGTGEATANAALIAAAPTLLESLERIVSIKGSTGGAESLVKEYRFIAEQALAKVSQ